MTNQPEPTKEKEASPIELVVGDDVAATIGEDDFTTAFIGKVLNEKYVVDGVVGHGGDGTVFRATEIGSGKRMAIKVLSDNFSETSRSYKRFNQEVRTTRFLKHENIVGVYEYGVENEHPYFVMEYIDGVSLAKTLEAERPLALERTLNIIRQTTAALAFAHKQGIVHRDVKPGNIMIDEKTGGVKLVDFGVAKKLSFDAGDDEGTTHDGEVIGTPQYLSPEQADGKQVDQRSDLYSLGCVLYECLTGKPPHVGSTAVEILMNRQKEPVVRPSEVQPSKGITEELDLIVLKLLAKKPIDRYQSAEDLLSDLNDLKEGIALNRSKFFAVIDKDATTGTTKDTLSKATAEPLSGSKKDVPANSQKAHEPPFNAKSVLIVLAGLVALIGIFCSLTFFKESPLPQAEAVGYTIYYRAPSADQSGMLVVSTPDSAQEFMHIDVPKDQDLNAKMKGGRTAGPGDRWNLKFYEGEIYTNRVLKGAELSNDEHSMRIYNTVSELRGALMQIAQQKSDYSRDIQEYFANDFKTERWNAFLKTNKIKFKSPVPELKNSSFALRLFEEGKLATFDVDMTDLLESGRDIWQVKIVKTSDGWRIDSIEVEDPAPPQGPTRTP